MFSLRDLRFLLCSRDLDTLRSQRIMCFLILVTHKSTRSENNNYRFVSLPLRRNRTHQKTLYFPQQDLYVRLLHLENIMHLEWGTISQLSFCLFVVVVVVVDDDVDVNDDGNDDDIDVVVIQCCCCWCQIS